MVSRLWMAAVCVLANQRRQLHDDAWTNYNYASDSVFTDGSVRARRCRCQFKISISVVKVWIERLGGFGSSGLKTGIYDTTKIRAIQNKVWNRSRRIKPLPRLHIPVPDVPTPCRESQPLRRLHAVTSSKSHRKSILASLPRSRLWARNGRARLPRHSAGTGVRFSGTASSYGALP